MKISTFRKYTLAHTLDGKMKEIPAQKENFISIRARVYEIARLSDRLDSRKSYCLSANDFLRSRVYVRVRYTCAIMRASVTTFSTLQESRDVVAPRRENPIQTRFSYVDSRYGLFQHLSSWPRYHPEAITGYLAIHTVFFPAIVWKC